MWWHGEEEREKVKKLNGTWYEDPIDFKSKIGCGNPNDKRKHYKDITYSIYHVVIHECAHLRIKEHNKKFYNFCRRLESKFLKQ